jgi:hypothetical protein
VPLRRAAPSASDGSFATCALGPGGNSQYLTATNFGFALTPIHTVTGIVAEWQYKQNGSGTITDTVAYLVLGGVIQTGTNRALGSTWPSGVAIHTAHGGSTDLWGQSSITFAQVNAANFGVTLRCTNGGGAPDTASVDHARVTVHYVIFTGRNYIVGQAVTRAAFH